MARRQQLDMQIDGTASQVFTALGKTLAFRRWHPEWFPDARPPNGSAYQWQIGSVRRTGRVVETIRPLCFTLKEVLHDPPCRVVLTMRWRIDPNADGCVIRLRAHYRLNHAAILRGRHWDRRLALHFGNQLRVLRRQLVDSRAAENVI